MTNFGEYMAKDFLKYYKRGLKYGDRVLPSGYFEGQTWGALNKCFFFTTISSLT